MNFVFDLITFTIRANAIDSNMCLITVEALLATTLVSDQLPFNTTTFVIRDRSMA